MAAGCFCEPGYVGVTCEACASGYVLDSDGESCSPDDDCTMNGSCPGAAFVDHWGTDKNDVIYALALDAAGALYAAGRTAGELDGHTSSGGGSDEIAGGHRESVADRWTEQWGTGATEEATGLVVDDDGGLFVSGHSAGLLGPAMFGRADAVLTRLAADHSVDWTVQWGSGEGDRPSKMVRSSDGALLVLGATAGNLGRTNPDSTKSDSFLTKLSTAGAITWTVQWGADENDYAFGLAAGPSGSAYVVGGTSGDLVADQHQGGVDLYCTKIDASGVIEWSVQWGGDADEYAYGVAVLPSGEALVVSDRGTFAADEGSGSMLITKISADGDLIWTRAFGVDTGDVARAIALASDGTFYVAGVTYGDLAVDGHVGMGDVFLSKRDDDGQELWAQQFGTSGQETVEAIVLGADRVYVGGSTTGDAGGVAALGMTDNLIVGFELEP